MQHVNCWLLPHNSPHQPSSHTPLLLVTTTSAYKNDQWGPTIDVLYFYSRRISTFMQYFALTILSGDYRPMVMNVATV
jgi:hypothetical protein